jgi:hypothetical protein
MKVDSYGVYLFSQLWHYYNKPEDTEYDLVWERYISPLLLQFEKEPVRDMSEYSQMEECIIANKIK